MKSKVLFACCLIITGLFNPLKSQLTEKVITRDTRYLLYLPDNYGKDTTVKWPLILFLHGGGERGMKLDKLKANGLPKIIEQGKKLPFIIVSPQIPKREFWSPDPLIQLLKDVVKKYDVDEDRIYLTGLSIGGMATWETSQKYPEVFAAIAPVSGWGDPLKLWKIRHMPVWIFHGAKDPTVPVIASLVMADSLKQYNHVKLTVYPEAGHNCWTETYDNDSLYKWFLDHKRFRFVQGKITGSPEKYCGLFLAADDTAAVSQSDGKLGIRYGQKGSLVKVMKPADENTFFLNEGDLNEIKYIKDSSGRMSSFIFYDTSKNVFRRIK